MDIRDRTTERPTQSVSDMYAAGDGVIYLGEEVYGNSAVVETVQVHLLYTYDAFNCSNMSFLTGHWPIRHAAAEGFRSACIFCFEVGSMHCICD